MISRSIFLLVTIATAMAAAPTRAVPISSVETYQGHEYVLLSEAAWLDAEADAQDWGGHLVAINDAGEQNWLVETFGTALYWIGLSDRLGGVDESQEGIFRWSNGDAVTFENWDYDEPNNSTNGGASPDGEHFVEMNRFGVGLWNDLPVWSTRAGIAERVAVPEPATLAMMFLGLLALVGIRRWRV